MTHGREQCWCKAILSTEHTSAISWVHLQAAPGLPRECAMSLGACSARTAEIDNADGIRLEMRPCAAPVYCIGTRARPYCWLHVFSSAELLAC